MKKLGFSLLLAIAASSSAQTINPNQIRGIGVYASGYTTLSTIESACGSAPCEVIVTTPQTFTLTANHTIPSSIRLTFLQSGEWTVNGAFTLTVGSGLVEGPRSTQIFAGTSAIAGLNHARPEWFGALSGASYPSSTVLAAYNATVAGGCILFNNANYISPWNTANGNNVVTVNHCFMGAGKAQLDSQTAPTRYVSGSGTVIQGTVNTTASTTIKDLSIDRGSYITTNLFGGVHDGGLFLASDHTVINQYKGVDWENIGVLDAGTGAADGLHPVLLENAYGAVVKHFEVAVTGNGTHAFINKSSNGYLEDIHAWGAGSDDYLCKSDYATFADGNCQNNTVVGLWLGTTAQADFGGIWESSTGDAIFGNTYTDVHELNLLAGYRSDGSGGYTVSNVIINGAVSLGMQGACFAPSSANGSMLIENWVCAMTSLTTPGSSAFGSTGQTFSNLEIYSTGIGGVAMTGVSTQNGLGQINGVYCHDMNGACITNGSSVNMDAANIRISNISGGLSSGPVFNMLNNPVEVDADIYWNSPSWRCLTAPCTLWSVRDTFNNVQASLSDGGAFFASSLHTTLATPASSSAACAAGQIGVDATYVYVCTATNTWKRVALATF